MATWADVQRVARALPEVTADTGGRHRVWNVRGKPFAWERPLRKRDLTDLGTHAPSGQILAVRVADLGAKEEFLADEDLPCFTIPHFDRYPGLLIRLDDATEQDLVELLTEAWLCMAPKALAAAYERDVVPD